MIVAAAGVIAHMSLGRERCSSLIDSDVILTTVVAEIRDGVVAPDRPLTGQMNAVVDRIGIVTDVEVIVVYGPAIANHETVAGAEQTHGQIVLVIPLRARAGHQHA